MRGGDQMRLDLGGVGEGHYLSDFARTVMVGELNQKYVDIYQDVRDPGGDFPTSAPASPPASSSASAPTA